MTVCSLHLRAEGSQEGEEDWDQEIETGPAHFLPKTNRNGVGFSSLGTKHVVV